VQTRVPTIIWVSVLNGQKRRGTYYHDPSPRKQSAATANKRTYTTYTPSGVGPKAIPEAQTTKKQRRAHDHAQAHNRSSPTPKFRMPNTVARHTYTPQCRHPNSPENIDTQPPDTRQHASTQKYSTSEPPAASPPLTEASKYGSHGPTAPAGHPERRQIAPGGAARMISVPGPIVTVVLAKHWLSVRRFNTLAAVAGTRVLAVVADLAAHADNARPCLLCTSAAAALRVPC